LKAVKNVNTIIGPALIGKNVVNQEELDHLMLSLDGTDNKENLGGNSIVGVSIAICKAGAAEKGIPLYRHIADLAETKKIIIPVPAFNVINGGSHAGNMLATQEFMIIPVEAVNFKEALRIGSEVYHFLKIVISEKYGEDAIHVGDEGGFAPNISSSRDALDLLKTAIFRAGYFDKVKIGLDFAASEFCFDEKKFLYNLDYKDKNRDKKKILSSKELMELYLGFIRDYPIILIEDPFDQEDWDSFSKFTEIVGKNIQVVGDDIFVTNPKRIQKGIDSLTCNSLLLKVNQIGTVTESIKSCKLAKSNGWKVMVSHRSGETEDSFIADLVVGLGIGQIKSGAPCRSEHLSKYNQILRIEEELGKESQFYGIILKERK